MIQLTDADPDSADARCLIGELSAALAAISGDSGSASFHNDDVRGARARFVLARGADGALLGCAGLRPLDTHTCELKRMYARSRQEGSGQEGSGQERSSQEGSGQERPGQARPGRGTGAALLAHMEQQAALLGYRNVWLETRRVNTRALAFYARHGYQPIANYGKYAGRPDAVCLGKTLTPPGPVATD